MASQVAQVAELVDALASGASFRMEVEVRVFSWAPTLKELKHKGFILHLTALVYRRKSGCFCFETRLRPI